LKSVLKNGKNQFAIDENRRDTYKHSLDSGHGLSILTNLEGELKQLMAVCISFFFFFSIGILLCFSLLLWASGIWERKKGGGDYGLYSSQISFSECHVHHLQQ
jgi:hypothetical protein